MKEKGSFRPIPGLSREAEEKRLAEIIGIAQENLTRTVNSIRQLSDDLYEIYEQMEAEESEAKQSLSLLHNTQSRLRENQRELIRCQKARKKPYFGRIDFKDPKQPWGESYYVGRVGISGEDSEPAVIDWRAPIASVYYENALGPCEYTVKNEGTCKIHLQRKRTYEIAEDRLKDFFDSDVVATDELLNKYLAKSKKAVLEEIIATIQKEQNAVIRRTPKVNLIVQGAAGSGKTTVAMHRISYILYNYEEDFRPEDFYIVGSNRILLNYITSVLPDLDVYGVSQMTMEELFVRLLYEDWKPQTHSIRPAGQKEEDACVKGSYEWFRDLERFCREYEHAAISKGEVRLEKNGVLILGEAAIRNYLENNPLVSMQGKINMLNEILLSRLENELSGKYVSYTPEEKKELRRMYRWHFGKDVWKGSVFDVYEEFLEAQSRKGKPVSCPGSVFDVYDLAALAYLYKRIKETDGIREASHVIIDEAQDFGMTAYGALAYCLRGCTYTIMGDVSQNIRFGYGLNDWEDLKKLLLNGVEDRFVLLKKSYRNTVEISDFAAGILRHGNFSVYPTEPISRHGREVQVTECRDEEDMLREGVKIIRQWQQAGHETIAVICRDEAETAMVRGCLGNEMELAGKDPENPEFGNGVMVLPVEYTKGLEFDGVLIYDPSADSYPAEDAYVKLLYVAATRALHELAVVHSGDLTDLIRKPVPEEKHMHSLEHETQKETGPFVGKQISAGAQPEKVKRMHETPERVLPGHKNPEGVLSGHKNPERVLSGHGKPIREPPGSILSAVKKTRQDPVPVNRSSHQFNECPDRSLLRPAKPSPMDLSIRKVRKRKNCLDLISDPGILRLIPLEEGIIRVQFRKGQTEQWEPGYWNYEPEKAVSWTARAGKGQVAVDTGKIAVRIDKRTGALRFFDRTGKRLLAEKAALPRQIAEDALPRTWVHLDLPEHEKIFAKGIIKNDLVQMNHKARYISFGGRKLRMPLLVSAYGYGIGIAAEETVMCCMIPMYGTYLYTEGKAQADYYFLYGGNTEAVLQMYQKL